MKIGEISSMTGIPVETIRYYEKIGLLSEPEREASSYRRYQHHHVERLLFIKRCRNLDMAQDEIRDLVKLAEQPGADCGEVDALLARHLHHVRERLQELNHLEKTLEQLQKACSENRTVSECGILDELTADLDNEPAIARHNHIPRSHGKR
ncbi:MAG: Cd(II)/Pb(II)-responsive transcriptional regulator [Marinobacter sp.]|uniref:Cd(II)/Pb(II)-responsive transcriptional regulator n=1 Tax=Marinobacter sp. TaxID=50741 RepID=UPI00349FEA8B